MSIIPCVRRNVLAASFPLPLLAAFPAQAQGDGPPSMYLEKAGREAAEFEACVIEHHAELQALYDLSADWAARSQAWDRL